MFGKKTRTPQTSAESIFKGLRRGHGDTPLGTEQHLPDPVALAARPEFRLDPRSNTDGAFLLGLAGAEITESRSGAGRPRQHAVGGHFFGIRDDRHLTISAGSRAGKGVSILIPNLLAYAGSAVVCDPKGDNATETARYRAEVLGHSVFVIDPFCTCGPSAAPYRSGVNPLRMDTLADSDALIERAALIADALVKRNPSAKDPHWDDSAQQLVEAVVLHVMTWPAHAGERNLRTVYRLLMHEAGGGGDKTLPPLAEAMLANEAAEGAVAAGACAHFERGETEGAGVLSSVRRHLHFLKYQRIARSLEDGPVNLADLPSKPTTIYICLPATRMGTCSGYLRLFVNLVLEAFESNASRRDFQKRSGALPTLLMLDEFATLGHMQRLEDAAGQIAGLGLRLITVVQDLTQLKSLYGDRWETFLGNSGALIFFGNMDLFTLDYLEKRLGQTLVYKPSHSQPTFNASINSGATGASFGVDNHPLMTVPEIASIFGREDPLLRMLVLLPTIGPVILQRAFYDTHPVLRALHGSS